MRVASDEQIGLGFLAERLRHVVPEPPRIQRAALEVQHAVVFGNQVQPSARAGHPREFGDHAVGMRDRMQHVAADDEIERAIRRVQLEHALVLEGHPRSQRRGASARERQVRVDDVDAEDKRLRVQLAEAEGDLARATAGVEDSQLPREIVPPEQLDLLRPDCIRLRREIADHRLVRHLLCLRIEIGHRSIMTRSRISSVVVLPSASDTRRIAWLFASAM